jgi:aryl sulfotransferase
MPDGSARRIYRTWILDGRRWNHYRPRAGDIVIATSPKCGTTWMQRIVALLVFQSPDPLALWQISPWIERRFPEPIEAVLARLETQEHRRFVKTHLPLDGLPDLPGARWIHVARDGRDACLSYHHHCMGFTAEALAALDREGTMDETIGRPYPPIATDPVQFFQDWLERGIVPGHADGYPFLSYFHLERTFWQRRADPAFLLAHYDDLKANLGGEMRRVADFLGIAVPPERWPDLVAAAGFNAMRCDGATLMGAGASMFQGGAQHFFARGEVGRWHGVLGERELAQYEAKVRMALPPACARWLANGRLRAGDPATTTD